MHAPIRTLALVLGLTAALAPLARAGGTTARIEAPCQDGSYIVRTATCGAPASMSVTASAEGIVSGQRKSLPLQLKGTKEKGVYVLARTWPSEGTWIVRLQPAGHRGPVTVAAIGSDGRVGDNEYLWDTDGRHECDVKLAANTK